MFSNELDCLKKVKIVFEIKSAGRSTMMSTPEMVDSFNELILTDRRVTIDDISKQLEILVDSAHKILNDDLAFF